MCLSMVFFGLIILGTLRVSWTWISISFPRLRKFSTIISSIISPCFSLCLLWDHYNANIILHDIEPEITYLHFLKFFFILLLCLGNFHCLVFQLTDSFFYFIWSAVEPFEYSFQFRFNFCLVLSYTFYLFVEVLLCSSILLPSLVSIFMNITLNYLSDKELIFISLMSFSGDLSCSLVWSRFFCLLILPDYLCLSIGIKKDTYFSQFSRSVLVYETILGAQKHSLPWVPEPGSQEVALV